MIFRLSNTARAILWLWQTDRANWHVADTRAVHQQTGIGLNNRCELTAHYNIPNADRSLAYTHDGQEIRLKWYDRHVIRRIVFKQQALRGHREVQRQISDWGADQIENRINSSAQMALHN